MHGIRVESPAAEAAAEFLESRRLHGGLYVEVGEDCATLEAQRFALEARDALGAACDQGVEELACLLAACACPGGGYAARPGHPPAAHERACRPELGATYYACRLNVRLPRAPALASTRAFLLDAAFGDGGVRVDVDDLFYALRGAVFARCSLSRRRRAQVRRFLAACQAPDGGFARLPGEPADVERTYCALQLTRQLGPRLDARAPRAWLERCVDADSAVHWDPSKRRCTPATLYWGTGAAGLAGLELDAAGVRAAVLAHANEDGGFGDGPASTIWETYCAVRTLARLDAGGARWQAP